MFSLTVGGRYSIDENGISAWTLPLVGIVDCYPRAVEDKNVLRSGDPGVRTSRDNFSLYYSISTGFQGGGYNGGAFALADIGEGYEPEKLMAYEIGWKSELLNGRLKLNGAVFYYNYRDIQLFSLSATSTGGFSQTIANTRQGTSRTGWMPKSKRSSRSA